MLVRLSLVLFPILLSTSAMADCLNLLPPIEVPFAGVTLPQNAELRVIDEFLEPIVLTLPDRTSRFIAVESDELGEVVALPDDLQPLPVGSYEWVQISS
jgi:hypothetical protein